MSNPLIDLTDLLRNVTKPIARRTAPERHAKISKKPTLPQNHGEVNISEGRRLHDNALLPVFLPWWPDAALPPTRPPLRTLRPWVLHVRPRVSSSSAVDKRAGLAICLVRATLLWTERSVWARGMTHGRMVRRGRRRFLVRWWWGSFVVRPVRLYIVPTRWDHRRCFT